MILVIFIFPTPEYSWYVVVASLWGYEMDLYYFEVLWWSCPVHVPDLHSRDSRSQMNSGFEI